MKMKLIATTGDSQNYFVVTQNVNLMDTSSDAEPAVPEGQEVSNRFIGGFGGMAIFSLAESLSVALLNLESPNKAQVLQGLQYLTDSLAIPENKTKWLEMKIIPTLVNHLGSAVKENMLKGGPLSDKSVLISLANLLALLSEDLSSYAATVREAGLSGIVDRYLALDCIPESVKALLMCANAFLIQPGSWDNFLFRNEYFGEKARRQPSFSKIHGNYAIYLACARNVYHYSRVDPMLESGLDLE